MDTKSDSFKPKYTNFHPQSTVWVTNPFNHDVVFQVADERNRQFQYRILAHDTADLPGGAVATLGVKAIVDELIQNSKEDNGNMWDEKVRKKYEDQVIVRIKDAPLRTEDTSDGGEVILSANTEAPKTDVKPDKEVEEVAFPDLKEIVAKSLPNKDKVLKEA